MADSNKPGHNRIATGPLADIPEDELTRDKSEFVNLNTQFGQLNPLFDSGISDIPYNQRENVGFFQRSKKQLESSYSADIFENSGPYVGVVLRIESNEVALKAAENNWLIRSQLGENPDPPPLLSLRVRIPEIHAALPIPVTFTSQTVPKSGVSGLLPKASSKNIEEEDKRIIDMYPIFSSADTKTSAYLPEIGSLVWVDFVDKKTQSAGVYLRPVNADKTTINSEAGSGNSSKPFSQNPQTSTGAKAAQGGSGGQVATTQDTNSPTLQKAGANFYSSKGGFVIPPRTTIGGISSKALRGSKVTPSSNGSYSAPTRIRYLKNIQIVSPEVGLRTNRVRVYAYGSVDKNSKNLVDVPSAIGSKRQKLHILAAERLDALNLAWFEYITKDPASGMPYKNANEIDGIFKISKGFTEHKYNDNYDSYSQKMIEKYGSVKEAAFYEPFRSAYETGLVFDIGNNGFQSGVSVQSSVSWSWLIQNAYLYGIYPSGISLKRWEVQVPRRNWNSGGDFANSKDGSFVNGKYYKYCTYVIEESIKSGRLTSDEKFETETFK